MNFEMHINRCHIMDELPLEIDAFRAPSNL